MALNPDWTGSADELLAAMEAHLAGRSVRFSNAAATQGGSVNNREDGKNQENSEEKCKSWEKNRQSADAAFMNVCHVQTHNLQIDFIDEGTKERGSREVPVVLVYKDPPVLVISEFMSCSECEAILALTKSHWSNIDEKLSSAASLEERHKLTQVKGIAKLPWGQSELLDRLLRRAAAVCGVPTTDFEELFILRYQSNEGSKEHLEALDRRSTLLVYLNEVTSGGETDFPQLGFQIRPQTGTAVFWHNVKVKDANAEGEGKFAFDCSERETRLLHASLPVQNGEKFVLIFYIKTNAQQQ